MKKFRLIATPKTVNTAKVQGRQKTVTEPRTMPIPDNEELFALGFFCLNSSIIPATIIPANRLKTTAKVIFKGVKLAPITHIKSLLPGNFDIKK